MSGEARISGQINIDPPIAWFELRDKRWTGWTGDGTAWTIDAEDRHPDVVVKLATATEDTLSGVAHHYTGAAIVPTGVETNGFALLHQVDRVVRTFGKGRTFTGFLHVVWGTGRDTHIYRVIVKDGKAIEVHPTMTWPEGARDEDAVSGKEEMGHG